MIYEQQFNNEKVAHAAAVTANSRRSTTVAQQCNAAAAVLYGRARMVTAVYTAEEKKYTDQIGVCVYYTNSSNSEQHCCKNMDIDNMKTTFFCFPLQKSREALQEIMTTSDPREMKAVGRRVRGFDADLWDQKGYDVVVKGNLAKFRQNPIFREELLATRDKVRDDFRVRPF